MTSIPKIDEIQAGQAGERSPWDEIDSWPDYRLCGAFVGDKTLCLKKAVPGKGRCRSHGGAAGAPCGPRNGNWKTGAYSKATKDIQRAESAELKYLYKLGQDIGLFPKRRGQKR